MTPIKNIVFDFGGILFDIDIPLAIHNMSQLVDVPNPSNEAIPSSLTPILQAYEVGNINTETFIWKLQHLSKDKKQALAYIKAWNSMLLGMKQHKFQKLLALRKDYNVFLLSNINDLHLNWCYRYFESQFNITDWDEKYFDKTYYSHLINKRKPDLSTFEWVWNDANIKPEESLFIDDTLENIIAAQKLGIQTIHHDPKHDIFDILNQYLN